MNLEISLVGHGKKKKRFGSRERKPLDFVDPNRDPHTYIERYVREEDYRDWFSRNYPDHTIYEAVGLTESDLDAAERRFAPAHEETSLEPEPEPDDIVSGKWTSEPSKSERPRVAKRRDSPPTEPVDTSTPPVSSQEEILTKKRTNVLFWMRIAFALIGGAIATFAFDSIEDSEEKRWTSIIFMIGLFVATCVIAKGMKINFSRADRKKLVTTGIGSYIFLYLFAWILSYTLLNLPQSNIPTPFT
ncbi:MAG: hypothetical protein MK216_00055 [Candidatus Nitrosopelagicus sp.]|nr:hypothetical protein [Candidatus Nitrosopelagicus sp.]